MIAFWIMTGLAAAGAALLVLTGARSGADPTPATQAEIGARELAELDRLKARGLLDEAAHAAARAEAARRLLAGQSGTTPAPQTGRRDRLWVLSGIAAATAAALGLYILTGSPGLPDQAYQRRVDDWSTRLETLQPAQLAAVAARAAQDRPNDPQALAMLGAARFAADDPLGAASAFRRLIEREPENAQAWAFSGSRSISRRKAEAAPKGSSAAKRAAPSMARAWGSFGRSWAARAATAASWAGCSVSSRVDQSSTRR